MSEADRNKIGFVARGKWQELISEIRKYCAAMANLDLRIRASADEFIVERVIDGWIPKRLRLEYDSFTPRILWTCIDPQEHRGEIVFRAFNDSVFYVVDERNTPLSDIVVVLTSCVTGKV